MTPKEMAVRRRRQNLWFARKPKKRIEAFSEMVADGLSDFEIARLTGLYESQIVAYRIREKRRVKCS